MAADASKYKFGFDVVASKGIFVGAHQIRGPEGGRAGRFHVFAAPKDLNLDEAGQRVLMTFKETATELARRGNWLGCPCCEFDAAHYAEQLFAGLKDGSAVGKWFIPTREILCGRDNDGSKVESENLYDLRNTGALKNSFYTGDVVFAQWYWSSWEYRTPPPNLAWFVDFSRGTGGWGHKEVSQLSCRPVRVELIL